MNGQQPSSSGITAAELKRAERANETDAQRQSRLAANRARNARNRSKEEPSTKKIRLEKEAKEKKNHRAGQSPHIDCNLAQKKVLPRGKIVWRKNDKTTRNVEQVSPLILTAIFRRSKC